MSAITLSIIIVNWNTRELVAACLDSVQRECASFAPGAVETLVVDNASTDGSARMLGECFPWVKRLENGENVGFARANNQALRVVAGRYALLLNSDTVIQPGALHGLVAFLDQHPRAGAAGPRLLNGDGTLQAACHPMLTPGREFWRLSFLEQLAPKAKYPLARWDVATPRHVEVIKGACLLLRQAALAQVGLLDESYFMYTEEVDLCYRLAQAGWELWYVPAAAVTHFGEGSTRQMPEAMYVQLYRSKVQFYRKYGGAARANRFKLLMIAAYLPRWAVTALAAPLGSAWRARCRTYGRLLAALPGM